jgi:hypothetical protein
MFLLKVLPFTGIPLIGEPLILVITSTKGVKIKELILVLHRLIHIRTPFQPFFWWLLLESVVPLLPFGVWALLLGPILLSPS